MALAGAEILPGPASLTVPMLVAVDGPPLTGLVGQSLRFEHVMGADAVRFVLHERVGFVRRPGSKVVRLSGLA